VTKINLSILEYIGLGECSYYRDTLHDPPFRHKKRGFTPSFVSFL
jgi:hypothetical protein